MSAATVPAVESIEALDFDPEIPCEHSEHDYAHPGDEFAAWLVRAGCETCGIRLVYAICAPGLRAFNEGRGYARCDDVWAVAS